MNYGIVIERARDAVDEIIIKPRLIESLQCLYTRLDGESSELGGGARARKLVELCTQRLLGDTFRLQRH